MKLKEYTKSKDKFEDVALELAVAGPKLQEMAGEVEKKVGAMREIIRQAKMLQLQAETSLKKDSLASSSHMHPNRF